MGPFLNYFINSIEKSLSLNLQFFEKYPLACYGCLNPERVNSEDILNVNANSEQYIRPHSKFNSKNLCDSPSEKGFEIYAP